MRAQGTVRKAPGRTTLPALAYLACLAACLANISALPLIFYYSISSFSFSVDRILPKGIKIKENRRGSKKACFVPAPSPTRFQSIPPYPLLQNSSANIIMQNSNMFAFYYFMFVGLRLRKSANLYFV